MECYGWAAALSSIRVGWNALVHWSPEIHGRCCSRDLLLQATTVSEHAIVLNGTNLEHTTTCTYLGITLDSTLYFLQNIRYHPPP